MGKNKIILIGGSPTVGKSFTARKLAEWLKIPWISTDTIREQMREIVKKKDYPMLYFSVEGLNSKPGYYLKKHSAEQIVKHQNQESIEVWKGVKAIIETDYVWNSFIVEGVAILPKLVAKLAKKNKNIKAFFLVDENLNRVRKTIFTRGLWDDAHKYPHDVKEKEVEWVGVFNKYLIKESKKYKFPVIRAGKQKNFPKQFKKILKKIWQ